jgi:hypothetical protein
MVENIRRDGSASVTAAAAGARACTTAAAVDSSLLGIPRPAEQTDKTDETAQSSILMSVGRAHTQTYTFLYGRLAVLAGALHAEGLQHSPLCLSRPSLLPWRKRGHPAPIPTTIPSTAIVLLLILLHAPRLGHA